MEKSSHDLHGPNKKLHDQGGSSAIYQGDSSITKPSERNSQHQQPPQDGEKDFGIKDNLTLADLKRESLCQKLSESTENAEKIEHASSSEASEVSTNTENDDDGKDIVVRELRNGCDKTFFDQKQDIFSLPDQLENLHLSQTSTDDMLKENVPEKSSTNTKNSVNLTTSTHRKICTNTCNSSFTVIPLAGQNTTRAKDTNKSKSEKDLQEQCSNLRLDKTATTFSSVRGAIRGKNIVQCFTTNLNTEAVNVSNSYKYTAAITNQTPLKYACQSPNINVLPLHACNTFNHSHNNHHHHHIHHHHNHNNQSEIEKYANELTNALSSRSLFQITNNSSYCTNSASKSQVKRQFSFLKSQSLEIVQDSPSIIYYETDDDDEQLFLQLSETDNDEPQHNHHKNSHYFKEHRLSGPQQSNPVEDEPSICTRSTNSREVMADEGLSITRSLSLSSQKTGVPLKTQSLDSRPIYPNVPYSPYASPYSSPRSNRRRPPLRESRRVSIEQTGSFLQLNQYKLMDQIGQGSYGLVKLAYSEEDSTHYAMKILSKRRLLRQAGLMKRGPKKSTSPLDRVYHEIAVLKKLDHPNVVKLVEVLDDPLEDSLYMVFELVKQGEVLSVPTKNPLSEERAWSVFRDTILGLEYLHYQRIIHADIKPGNLLLTGCGRVKIADLGVCNEFIGEDATMTNGSTAGTPAFRAPESLNVGQNIYCGKAADIWALGATLYALVYGNVPFVASSIPALYEKIKMEELSFPEIPKTSAELRDCIQSMLKKDPGDRITLPQLKEHVWVNACGLHPLPSEEENCRLVQVNDDDINSVVRSIPKLDTLILIKTMLKKHSFGNPFSRGISGRAPQRGGSRLERFIRAGRSNSAPGSYNMIVDRQLSGDNILPALCEHSSSSYMNEECQ